MKIGIFGAEEQEVRLLKEYFTGNCIKIAGLDFFDGVIMEQKIVLVCGGIGKVNAALCSQILISEFKVDGLINTGTAGALLEGLNVFDIVLSTDAVQHDVDASCFGYPPGQIPKTESPFWQADKNLKKTAFDAFKILQAESGDENIKKLKLVEGRIASGDVFDIVLSTDAVQHDVNAVTFGYPLGQVPMTKSPFWPADKKLKNLAVKAFKVLQKESDDEHIKNLKLVEGRIASGDAFVSDKKLRAKIIKEFNPACVEMEGAAVAQVCTLNKIPFLILRSMSDTAGKDKIAKISYDVFSAQAAKNSSMLVLEMLKML